MHKPGVGYLTLVGQRSIVLLLVVLLTIQATQLGDRFHDDVIEDQIFEGLDQLDYITHSVPTFSGHFGSDLLGPASNHCSSVFPWRTMNDIPLIGTQRPQTPEATDLQERTMTSHLPTLVPNRPPVVHHGEAFDCDDYRFAEILNSDFKCNDILKAAEPRHTHAHSGLGDSYHWEYQPLPAEPGPSFSTTQASESLRHDQDAVIRQNVQEDTRRLVTSEIPAPPRPRDGNFAGGHDLSERLHRDAFSNAEILFELINSDKKTKRRKATAPRMLADHSYKGKAVVHRRKFVKPRRDKVLKAVANGLGNADETMKSYYKSELSHLINPPFELLDDGNFQGIGAHNFLIESSVTDKNKLEQSLDPLSKYLSEYTSHYKPSKRKPEGQRYVPKQVSNRLQEQRRKSNVHAIYLAANGRFRDTDLGRTLEHLGKKWLDHMVKCYDAHGVVTSTKVLKSWYECFTYTAKIVLYNIELMYRLSIPMDKMLEEKKDNSLWEALSSLNKWWLNFPLFHDMPTTLLESNEFYSESTIENIKSFRQMHGGYLKFTEMSTVFLSNWFKRNHPVTFEKIKNREKIELLMPQVFGVLQDCTWIDYISMSAESQIKATTK